MKSETEIWMRQAEADLKTSKYNLDGGIYYASAFFSQQAAEKALKAYVMFKKFEFRKTHSVGVLAKRAGVDEKFLRKIIELDGADRANRYPDITGEAPCDEASKGDAKNFYNIAEEVIVWVKDKMRS